MLKTYPKVSFFQWKHSCQLYLRVPASAATSDPSFQVSVLWRFHKFRWFLSVQITDTLNTSAFQWFPQAVLKSLTKSLFILNISYLICFTIIYKSFQLKLSLKSLRLSTLQWEGISKYCRLSKEEGMFFATFIGHVTLNKVNE